MPQQKITIFCCSKIIRVNPIIIVFIKNVCLLVEKVYQGVRQGISSFRKEPPIPICSLVFLWDILPRSFFNIFARDLSFEPRHSYYGFCTFQRFPCSLPTANPTLVRKSEKFDYHGFCSIHHFPCSFPTQFWLENQKNLIT